MRSERRRRPLEHVLIAGHLADLDAIRAIVSQLPEHAYGQILIESDGLGPVPALDAPARVTVSVLSPAGRPTPGQGTLLAEAVAAWAAEWMPEDPEAGRELTVWVGDRASESVNAVCARLASLPERL